MNPRNLAIAVLSLGLVTACNGGGGGGGPYGGPDEGAGGRPAAAPAPVKSSDSDLGRILVDAEGRTLYLFEKDEGAKPTCYGACAEAWPPLVAEGEPRPGKGIDPELIGTAERQDGTKQVTYADHPLYYYVKDRSPGDVEGQDIDEFGAVWYAVGPDGEKVED